MLRDKEVRVPKKPVLVNPTLPVVPELTARDSAFGRADETAVLDRTTEMCEVDPRAAHELSAAEVPR